MLLAVRRSAAELTPAQVTWVVFETPIPVPTSQVVAYQAFIGEREHSLSLNARPLQPLNGRPVKRITTVSTGMPRL